MSGRRYLALSILLALGRAASGQQFTYNAAALPAQALWTDGVALADVDRDGDLDILFADGSAYGGTGSQGALAQGLYLNNGAGIFADASASLNVAAFNAKMVIAQDFDGDGWPDVLYASGSTGSPPRYLRNLGSVAGVWQGFVDETAMRIPPLALRSFCVCAGDVDNDGDLDVCVTDGGTFSGVASQARLLINDGTGVFTDATASRMPADLFNAQDVTLLDVDNDLDIDIVLCGKATSVPHSRLYLNDGTGVFTISPALDAVGSAQTYEIDYGDLDGDGDFDAAVESISGFNEGWARNDGVQSPWVKTTFPLPNGEDDNEMACFDFDSDGDLDVLVGSLGPTERIYANDGTGVFALAAGVVQPQADSTLDLAVGDLNGDGRYDIVTGQGESGNFTNKVYVNGGAPDVLPPVYELIETPVRIDPAGTVFRARVQDAISDDGQVNASLSFAWSTTGAGAASGSGSARPQGGGQFRALVPTPAGTTSATLTWTAADTAGNAAVSAPIVVTAVNAWSDLGFALAGTAGDAQLEGSGALLFGTPGTLTLTSARPSSMAALFISVVNSPTPFKGGQLVPVPPVSVLLLATNPIGAMIVAWPAWPSNNPGASWFLQCAIVDPAAPAGMALSNAVKGQEP